MGLNARATAELMADVADAAELGVTEGVLESLVGEEFAIRAFHAFGDDNGTVTVLLDVRVNLGEEFFLLGGDFRQ